MINKKRIIIIVATILICISSLAYESRSNKLAAPYEGELYQLQWGLPFPYLIDDFTLSETNPGNRHYLDRFKILPFTIDLIIIYIFLYGITSLFERKKN